MSSSTTWPCVALAEASLADRTTIRVGGRVEWLLEPTSPDELGAAWRAAREGGFRPRVLGGGANVVVADGLLPGVVISTERMRRVFRPVGGADREELDGLGGATPASPEARVAQPDPAEDPRLVAWCGATLPALLRSARDLGYSGLEGIVGVPGHVGGGITMNAGGRWGEMWDVLETVRVLDEDGAFVDLAREQCSPRYRDGNLGGRVVVGAVLRFRPEPKRIVAARMREYLVAKNAVQPVTEWSAGCVFKNPDPELSDGRSAGRLVEECGGKGLTRGDAIVSPLHGNFIVNRGQATATEVFALMEALRDLVAEKSGVRLEFEVKRWRAGD